MKLLFPWFFIALSMSAFAEDAVLQYGPEWTFTSEELIPAKAIDLKEQVRGRLSHELADYCAKTKRCTHTRIPSDGALFRETVSFTGGLVVEITQDPGVFEVKSTPKSLAEWKALKTEVQSGIFDVFKKQNLVPHEREGAGHLNIGLKYFENNPTLLRNFIVDFYNNPGVGLVLNSLADNDAYASYLDKLPTYAFQTMRANLTAIDAKSSLSTHEVLQAFNYLINKYVALGIRGASVQPEVSPTGLYPHYQLTPISRLEIRTLRPQANMNDFIKVIEIFEARIRYREKYLGKIPLKEPKRFTDAWDALQEFAKYLDEAGLDWTKYKSLMPEVWRNLPEDQILPMPMRCAQSFKRL